MPTYPDPAGEHDLIAGFHVHPVVGAAEDTAGNLRAFLYVNGSMRDIGTRGGANSSAVAINNKGQIAGVANSAEGKLAFLYKTGQA